ncbi:TatD family hydrolase [Deltaproteobacteria bacterium]|nr:TatD family hydrolase [Deltaproteobacteria bacterium]
MLIDSHAHLDMEDFKGDLEEVLERALNGGVTHIITIGIDIPSSLKALELANRYDFIYSSIGYHPHNAEGTDFKGLEELGRLASESKVVAWGEIGLDFFRNRSSPEKQIEVFEQQLETAFQLDMPVIIHDRDAHSEILDILRKKGNKGHRGVIHCFSGDYDMAMAFIDMGYYISIPGTVTFKNAFKVQDVASRVPIDRILVETDAPFLAPVPKRGKRNEPFFVTHTARKIAQIRGMDFNEFTLKTSENAKKLFGLQ